MSTNILTMFLDYFLLPERIHSLFLVYYTHHFFPVIPSRFRNCDLSSTYWTALSEIISLVCICEGWLIPFLLYVVREISDDKICKGAVELLPCSTPCPITPPSELQKDSIDVPNPVINLKFTSFNRENINFPATLGRPTLSHVIIEIPANTQSKAAEASNSMSIAGDNVWWDRSRKRILLSTVLLHVCPGSAYWEPSSAKCCCAWWIKQWPHIMCNIIFKWASTNCIIGRLLTNCSLPLSIMTWNPCFHRGSGEAVISEMYATSIIACAIAEFPPRMSSNMVL